MSKQKLEHFDNQNILDEKLDDYDFLSKNEKYAMLLVKPLFHSMDLGKSKKMANEIKTRLKGILGENKVPYELSGRFVEVINDTDQFKKDMVRIKSTKFLTFSLK